MPAIKHTAMREDLSIVNARQFSAERTDVTIQMALDSIGALYRSLLLTDEDDGIWTLNANVTIPQNVMLYIPTGVTIVGPGNLTILGGLVSMRCRPVHLGPGVTIYTNAVLGPVFSQINGGYLNVDDGYFNKVWINDEIQVGRGGSVGPDDPWPEPLPVADIYDTAMTVRNYFEVGAATLHDGALNAAAHLKCVSDTLITTGIQTFTSYALVDLNGFHMLGGIRGAESSCQIFSSAPAGGGTAEIVEMMALALNIQDSVRIERCTALAIYGITYYTPGVSGAITDYVGLSIGALPAWQSPGSAIQIQSSLNLSTDPTTQLFYNLLLDGTAPNHIQAPTLIGGATRPIQAPTYALFVNGIAQKPGGGSWTDSSSVAMKKAIEPLTGALDTMLRLRGTSYLWREEAHARVFPHRQMGFIAEEVREVLPDWVTETPEGELLLTERGTFAMTVEAMRDLDARLRALEGKETRDVPRSDATGSRTPEE